MTGNKIKTQREAINMELLQDLKYMKSTVEPKFVQLNVESTEVESIFQLLIARMDSMEKSRKLKKTIRKNSD